MRMTLIVFGALLFGLIAQAQQPVSWTYSVKKIGAKIYEIHLKASLGDGWHLYSQKEPSNFIGTPTLIKFTKHPLISISGVPIEVGKLVKKKEPALGIESWQYHNQVEFVQKVELKNEIRTNLTGTVEYQVCTDEKCLQPTTQEFSIALK